uniref:Ubiquinone biosynthesis protein n=1 Tax=Herpetomonas muscarum TaxID=5718 RepID=T1YSU8_HERMU|nr:ubiquinone biosynthesis protein [Herpetomonas muscarum]
MSTQVIRNRITSASFRQVAATAALLTAGGGLGTYVYYRKVWLPNFIEQHIKSRRVPPKRMTKLYVAGSQDGDGLLPEVRTMPTPIFYVYAAYRIVLLFVRSIPVVWFGLLVLGKLCPPRVFYEHFHAFLLSMGPSYIKLGQWMATRPDAFPEEMCSVLSRLYDRTQPHSWAHTEEQLRIPIADGPFAGQNALRFISEIEKVPINSGSIAQIHRGKLREEIDGVPAGTEVAIKVCHPHIHEQVSADLAAMRLFVAIGNTIIPGLKYFHLEASVREFSSLIRSQLNLLVECDNIKQFRHNFRDIDGVVFPVPLASLSSPSVLLETFEEGEPLQSVECSDSNVDIAEIGCQMFLKMLFEDNFVHSDLHPGNLLLRTNRLGRAKEYYPDGKRKLPREIVVLDAGLVTTLSKHERNNFISLFAAVACGDGELGADLMLDRLPEHLKVDIPEPKREKFRQDMKEVFDLVAPEADGFKLSNIRIGMVLGKVMRTVRENNTPLDGNFASLVLTVMVGEGLGRKLVPDFNIFAEAAPYLVAFLEDGELFFLAKKLRSTYGTTALLRDSVDLVRPAKANTYVAVAKKKSTSLFERYLRWSGNLEEEIERQQHERG